MLFTFNFTGSNDCKSFSVLLLFAIFLLSYSSILLNDISPAFLNNNFISEHLIFIYPYVISYVTNLIQCVTKSILKCYNGIKTAKAFCCS